MFLLLYSFCNKARVSIFNGKVGQHSET
jgi:hypothetical protein